MKKKCSICKKNFEFEYRKGEDLPKNFPFCGPKCKQIDLGRWFREEYQIADAEQISDQNDKIGEIPNA